MLCSGARSSSRFKPVRSGAALASVRTNRARDARPRDAPCGAADVLIKSAGIKTGLGAMDIFMLIIYAVLADAAELAEAAQVESHPLAAAAKAVVAVRAVVMEEERLARLKTPHRAHRSGAR